MANMTLSVNLTRLKGAVVTPVQGKTGMHDCIVIPIDLANLEKAANGNVYLNCIAWESKENQYGTSHMIKQSVSKEKREYMNAVGEQQVILGNIKPMQFTPTSDEVQGVTIDGEKVPF